MLTDAVSFVKDPRLVGATNLSDFLINVFVFDPVGNGVARFRLLD
jgi:hypothetical protein